MSTARSQTRRIAYGTTARLIGRTLGAFVSLVALREATRYFGPVQWGPITAALAWMGIFSYLGGPGLATFAMREIAKPGIDPAPVFGKALVTTAAVSIGAGVLSIALAAAVYWSRPETMSLVLILAPGIPLTALFLTGGSALIGRGRSVARGALDTVSSVFLLAATLVVVGAHLTGRGYAAAYLTSVVVSGLAALSLAAHALPPRFKGSLRHIPSTLRASLPFGQFDLFAVVYARADSIMVFLIKGSRPVALYGVAFQVATFLFALPTLLSNALLPEFMGSDTERRHFLARRALDVILTVAVPLPLFGALFARPFVIWLAGSAFAGAGLPLAILTGAAGVALLNGYLFQMSVFSGAEQGLWRVAGTVTAVNLVSNVIAVSFWGAAGAASVMVLSETVGLIMYWRLYRKKMPNPLGRRYPLSVGVAALVLLAVCWTLHVGLGLQPDSGSAILPQAIVLGLIYAALLLSVARVAKTLSLHRSENQHV